MSGWHYPDSGHGPWDGPSYEPDRPDPSEFLYGEGDDSDLPEPDLGLIHDPGFQEHEVDTHHDPDHGRDERLEDHRVGAILRQSDQWPDRVAGEWGSHGPTGEPDSWGSHGPVGHYDDYGDEENDWEHQREHEAAFEDEKVYNRDPAAGPTVPHMVGGDAEGVHSIEPGQGARVLHPHETGLEYAVLARPNEHGGFDVIRPLE